ncbi:RuvC-like Holliday junction resolvase [Stenotrophomonas phage Philippe]|uniref:RuvC-like resolvase n=1 Tax=Stenotrophomonas phage Philippe TaxID=2859655 RepID=A0AAE7WMM3_9CAUD|nr:RuvC-like Holliday junction resolvase [Stenotrophomonas phage Philippe]QYW02268.1 RuvC-like resolvase [Stenotrophomonas phage Philippe]
MDLARGHLTRDPEILRVQTAPTTSKQLRVNSDDLARAKILADGLYEAVSDCKAIFVEVPVGSQSARAMASYGICVGVLGSLLSRGLPLIEVTPTEVKIAMTGNKNASKEAMIAAARDLYPKAPWPMKSGQVVASSAEHMADAIGAIHAGVNTPAFTQIRRILGY